MAVNTLFNGYLMLNYALTNIRKATIIIVKCYLDFITRETQKVLNVPTSQAHLTVVVNIWLKTALNGFTVWCSVILLVLAQLSGPCRAADRLSTLL